MRSVIDYAAPVFFNRLPQHLKKELVRPEKRAVSIITSGKCNSAIEVGLTPILEHYYVLCSRLFDNIVRDPNHKLKALLPPDYDNSRHNLRRQRHFNMPKLCTNRTSNTFIYAMSKQSGLQPRPRAPHLLSQGKAPWERGWLGCSFISLIHALYFNIF